MTLPSKVEKEWVRFYHRFSVLTEKKRVNFKEKQDVEGIQNMSGVYLIGLTFIK